MFSWISLSQISTFVLTQIAINVLDEETDAYENMPDNLKDGERGSSSSDAIDYLEDASSSLDDIIDTINEAIDC